MLRLAYSLGSKHLMLASLIGDRPLAVIAGQQILDRRRDDADQDHNCDRQRDLCELGPPGDELDKLRLDLHRTHLNAIAPRSDHQRVRTALPSLPE